MDLLGWWRNLDDTQRQEVAILTVVSGGTSVAVLPYVIKLQGVDLSKIKIPLPVLVALSVGQSSLLFAVASGAGAALERRTGLRAPYLRQALRRRPLAGLVTKVPKMVGWGAGAAATVIVLDRVLMPLMPEEFRQNAGAAAQRLDPLTKLLASFYGGIAEEVLLRRGVMTALVAALAWLRAEDIPSASSLWAGNLGAALLFGAGHLPATAKLTPLTPVVILRALLLNGLFGLVAGRLYAEDGLETAMGAHFVGDIVIQFLSSS